jgi:acetyl esterase/lipase
MNKGINILNFLFRLIAPRRMLLSAFQNPPRRNAVLSMKLVFGRQSIHEIRTRGHALITFAPQQARSTTHLVYLHGGAYVWQGTWFHWKFVKTIARKIGCRATCVDYPKAPEHSYIQTFKMLEDGFTRLTQQYPRDRFVFMGDSSGGGLALAFAQKLAKMDFAYQPEQMILLSPWLDISMDNPEIHQVEKLDKMLTMEGLQGAADLYADGDDKAHYLLSPINGDLEGLGGISIFIGTHDLLWPDSKLLQERATKAGIKVAMHVYGGMPHTFMLFPLPESKDVIKKIVHILASN